MKGPTLLLAACFACLTLAAPARAQTPSELAASYFAVLQKEDYKTAASFFEPGTLTEFRAMMGFLKELPDKLAGDVFTQFFGDGQTKKSVSAMSDLDFFAHFLGGVMTQAKAFGDVILDQMEVIGEVPEGKEVVHVLTRSRAKLGEVEIEGMEVISFRLVDGKWKALLSGKMKGMAAQLKAALVESESTDMEAVPIRMGSEKPTSP